MTIDEFYNYITKYMTPEQALKKLLASQMDWYEKLKLPGEEGREPVSPIFIIANAAMDLGWDIVLEDASASEEIRGLMVGTKEYIDVNLKSKVR